jgi:hypothetical protein
MFIAILVILSIVIELLILGGVVYLFLKSIHTTPKRKIKVSVKPTVPFEPVLRQNKKIEMLPYDSIYTTNTLQERPIKTSDGDLIPYGLSDTDKALLEMFYEKD